jgi:hypothetical protein
MKEIPGVWQANTGDVNQKGVLLQPHRGIWSAASGLEYQRQWHRLHQFVHL